MRVGNTAATAGAVEAWLAGDWPLQFPGGDPGHFLWGTGPLGRNTESQLLRGLVKRAELAETPADRLRVVRAGIQALQGLAVALELDTEQES
jgi:hypothetical protein